MMYRLYVCTNGIEPRLVEWISRVPEPEDSETQLRVQYEDGSTEIFSELAWSIMLLGGFVKHESTTIKMKKVQTSDETGEER